MLHRSPNSPVAPRSHSGKVPAGCLHAQSAVTVTLRADGPRKHDAPQCLPIKSLRIRHCAMSQITFPTQYNLPRHLFVVIGLGLSEISEQALIKLCTGCVQATFKCAERT